MNCKPSLEHAAGGPAPLPELELHDVLGKLARDRSAAVLYLLAAAKAKDAAERNSLRRRAAELLLPGPGQTEGRLERSA